MQSIYLFLPQHGRDGWQRCLFGHSSGMLAQNARAAMVGRPNPWAMPLGQVMMRTSNVMPAPHLVQSFNMIIRSGEVH